MNFTFTFVADDQRSLNDKKVYLLILSILVQHSTLRVEHTVTSILLLLHAFNSPFSVTPFPPPPFLLQPAATTAQAALRTNNVHPFRPTVAHAHPSTTPARCHAPSSCLPSTSASSPTSTSAPSSAPSSPHASTPAHAGSHLSNPDHPPSHNAHPYASPTSDSRHGPRPRHHHNAAGLPAPPTATTAHPQPCPRYCGHTGHALLPLLGGARNTTSHHCRSAGRKPFNGTSVPTGNPAGP